MNNKTRLCVFRSARRHGILSVALLEVMNAVCAGEFLSPPTAATLKAIHKRKHKGRLGISSSYSSQWVVESPSFLRSARHNT